jgi:hypothetical protein
MTNRTRTALMDAARARRAKKKPQAETPTGLIGSLRALLAKAAAWLRATVKSITRT